MQRAIDLVMFDLDGTLADTGEDLADAVNFTRSYFRLPPLSRKLVLAQVGRGVEYLLRHSVPEETPHRFAEVMRVFLDRYEAHLFDKTVLYPNVEHVLDHFRDKRRVVVSNKLHHLTVALLRGLGVEKHFDAIFGGDSASDKKPHPALLNAALNRFDVAPGKALMVGDGEIDVQAGRGAGVITCGVTYGLGDRKALREAEPDVLVDNIADLVRYFC
jgi:2-phosphoglycolate phosphatase